MEVEVGESIRSKVQVRRNDLLLLSNAKSFKEE